MYNSVKIKLLITILFISSQVSLSADVEQQLINCTQIKSNVERLACYDNITMSLNSTITKDIAAKSKHANTVQKNEIKALTSVAENLENSSVDKPEVRIVYVEKPSEPTEIHANLVGDFKGWNPNSIFTLDNGQVWRAVRSNAKTKQLPNALSNPKISITPGAFGSSNLRVDGVKGKLKVKRIQ